MSMNKRDMIVDAAIACGCTQANVQKCFDAVLDRMRQAFVNGQKVQINHFGTFSVIERSGYWGIDPQTKKKTYYPPGKQVRFKGAVGLTGDKESSKKENDS